MILKCTKFSQQLVEKFRVIAIQSNKSRKKFCWKEEHIEVWQAFDDDGQRSKDFFVRALIFKLMGFGPFQ